LPPNQLSIHVHSGCAKLDSHTGPPVRVGLRETSLHSHS